MTKTHVLIVVAIATVVCTGVALYGTREDSSPAAPANASRPGQRSKGSEIAEMQRERDDAVERITMLESENSQLRRQIDELKAATASGTTGHPDSQSDASGIADGTGRALAEWMGRVNRVKERLRQSPGAIIPEMKLLTDENWLDVTREKIDSEADLARALNRLRDSAVNDFIPDIQQALRDYSKDNNGAFPTDVSLLQRYVKPEEVGMLQRYRVVPDEKGSGSSIALTAPVDSENDSRHWIKSNSRASSGGSGPWEKVKSPLSN